MRTGRVFTFVVAIMLMLCLLGGGLYLLGVFLFHEISSVPMQTETMYINRYHILDENNNLFVKEFFIDNFRYRILQLNTSEDFPDDLFLGEFVAWPSTSERLTYADNRDALSDNGQDFKNLMGSFAGIVIFPEKDAWMVTLAKDGLIWSPASLISKSSSSNSEFPLSGIYYSDHGGRLLRYNETQILEVIYPFLSDTLSISGSEQYTLFQKLDQLCFPSRWIRDTTHLRSVIPAEWLDKEHRNKKHKSNK